MKQVIKFFKGFLDFKFMFRLPLDKGVGYGSHYYVVGHFVGDAFVKCYETLYKSHLNELKKLHLKSYPDYSVFVFCLNSYVQRI